MNLIEQLMQESANLNKKSSKKRVNEELPKTKGLSAEEFVSKLDERSQNTSTPGEFAIYVYYPDGPGHLEDKDGGTHEKGDVPVLTSDDLISYFTKVNPLKKSTTIRWAGPMGGGKGAYLDRYTRKSSGDPTQSSYDKQIVHVAPVSEFDYLKTESKKLKEESLSKDNWAVKGVSFDVMIPGDVDFDDRSPGGFGQKFFSALESACASIGCEIMSDNYGWEDKDMTDVYKGLNLDYMFED